eukprot:10293839-Prorocentrum_lima.AAC.1
MKSQEELDEASALWEVQKRVVARLVQALRKSNRHLRANRSRTQAEAKRLAKLQEKRENQEGKKR